MFANIADAAQVAVINTRTNAIEATWKLKDASDNTPMAYDSQDQLLLIACRKPAVLLAMDANTGKEVSRTSTDDGADDLFYDAKLHRVYVITGVGAVDAYSISAAKHLTPLARFAQHPAPRPACWFHRRICLYVGIPSIGSKSARDSRVQDKFHVAKIATLKNWR